MGGRNSFDLERFQLFDDSTMHRAESVHGPLTVRRARHRPLRAFGLLPVVAAFVSLRRPVQVT
jgi:hypothetical protein